MSAPKLLNYRLIVPLVFLLLAAAACAPAETPAVSQSPTQTPFPAPATLPPTETAIATEQPADTPAPSPTLANASAFPDPAQYTWEEMITSLNNPVGLVSANDGSGRLFIIEQRGRILIYENGNLLADPFLDIRGRVGFNASEQGLLGLAFDPDYETSGHFFINYTDNNGNTVVSRFTVSNDWNLGDGSTESIILQISQPYQNHNGGQISFGPQGYLWIASGDGGGGGDPQGNSQNLENLLGKLLRIDIGQQPYQIPSDNPFGNEIWAYGLRNPWRFTFDPANGDLYIADVGQNKWEEIHYLPAGAPGGANFGWNYLEGNHPYQGFPPADVDLTGPVWEYDHSQGCSISGGAVYRGSMPEWQGIYIYSDFCSGLVWGLFQTPTGEWQNQQLYDLSGRVAAVDQDESGEVYLVDREGSILKLAPQ